ncbi:uncharacterized protein [Gossypium hirsutum]|uniref:Tf2-1-like SH3-like domain-containing protein n=1 Tax=Gossypium hirsutum TaxID=3635 RepID=A0A1U8NFG7_GOSHI|nr:uncharacterized protein LOC107947764 [Gossypium hirsutum]
MGTFFIHHVPYTALIDIGFTHSYMACTVSETLGVIFENTTSEVTVLSPLGQSMRVNKLFKEVPLDVQGGIFLADLMELLFGKFKLILGMHWLVKNQANFDCASKRVVLKTTEGDEVIMIGEHRNYLSNVISALRFEKLVRNGCEAYLAYVSASGSKVLAVRDIKIVKNFLDAFPDKLLGLPPNREVEFGIELLPEIQVKPRWIEQIKGNQLKDDSLGTRFQQIKSGEALDFGLNREVKLAKLYVSKIVRLQGVPISIISDRDLRFTSQFWKKLHEALATSREDYLQLAEFSYNNSYQSSVQMAPYDALYGHRCRTPTCWTELGERRVLGPELISDTKHKVRKIRDRLKPASDRQKSYTDLKRKEIEYSVEDLVFLKVSPWKKVLRFGQKGKLGLRFIGPYRILKSVGPFSYQLELPPELVQIHYTFYVSMLRRYRSDPAHIVSTKEIKARPTLTLVEEPDQFLDRDVKVLRRKLVPVVKVLWRNHSSKEATWEPDEAMRQQYPIYFDQLNFKAEIFF